jgi:hypothetical protein
MLRVARERDVSLRPTHNFGALGIVRSAILAIDIRLPSHPLADSIALAKVLVAAEGRPALGRKLRYVNAGRAFGL